MHARHECVCVCVFVCAHPGQVCSIAPPLGFEVITRTARWFQRPLVDMCESKSQKKKIYIHQHGALCLARCLTRTLAQPDTSRTARTRPIKEEKGRVQGCCRSLRAASLQSDAVPPYSPVHFFCPKRPQKAFITKSQNHGFNQKWVHVANGRRMHIKTTDTVLAYLKGLGASQPLAYL